MPEEATKANGEEGQPAQDDNAAKIAAAIIALRDAQNAQAEREDASDKKKRRIDVATIVLVFLTAIFTGLSWIAFRDQVHEMKEAYGPIKQQAQAGADQINIMRIQLKPHMSPRIESNAVVSNGQITMWLLTPVWKNVGGTEATKAFGWDSARFFENAEEADKYDFLSRHGAPDEMISKTVPQTEEFIQVSKPLPADVAKKITGLDGPVYVIWGHLEYGDALFPGTTHHAHFCYRVVPANVGAVLSLPLYKAECNFSD